MLPAPCSHLGLYLHLGNLLKPRPLLCPSSPACLPAAGANHPRLPPSGPHASLCSLGLLKSLLAHLMLWPGLVEMIITVLAQWPEERLGWGVNREEGERKVLY